MGTMGYSDQALEILHDERDRQARAAARAERHREIAREALQRAHYVPTEIDGQTIWIASPAPVTRLVRLRLASGPVVAVNPARVVSVLSEPTHGGVEVTILLLTTGDVYALADDVETVCAALAGEAWASPTPEGAA